MVRQRSRGRRVQLEMGASPEADHEPASSTQPITDTTVLMLSCVDIDADTQQPQQDQPPPLPAGAQRAEPREHRAPVLHGSVVRRPVDAKGPRPAAP